jgi:hypothetical protein
VRAVVAADPVSERIMELMRDVLGTSPMEVDGVHLWLVPPRGPTPGEPTTRSLDPTPDDVGGTTPG